MLVPMASIWCLTFPSSFLNLSLYLNHKESTHQQSLRTKFHDRAENPISCWGLEAKGMISLFPKVNFEWVSLEWLGLKVETYQISQYNILLKRKWKRQYLLFLLPRLTVFKIFGSSHIHWIYIEFCKGQLWYFKHD